MSIHLDRALEAVERSGRDTTLALPSEPTPFMIAAAQRVVDLDADTLCAIYAAMAEIHVR